MQPYRKQRCHTLMLIGYDFVLPILVVALGCFFSVTTLVLLFQVSRVVFECPSMGFVLHTAWLSSAASFL